MDVCILGEGELRRALELCYRESLRSVLKTSSYKNNPLQYKKERSAFYEEKFQPERYSDDLMWGKTMLLGVCQKKRLYGTAILNVTSGEIVCLASVKKNAEYIKMLLIHEMAVQMMKKGSENSLYMLPEEEGVSQMQLFGFQSAKDEYDRIRVYKSCQDIMLEGRPRAGIKRIYRFSKILFAGLAAVFLITFTKHSLIKGNVKGRYSAQEQAPPQIQQGHDTISEITPFAAKDLSYKIETERYMNESLPEKKYYTSFEGEYPIIKEGKSGVDGEKISAAIKACALDTERKFVTEPSPEVKSYMVSRQPILASKVRGTVVFATEDLLSVLFEDRYIVGNPDRTRLDLRAVTMNAQTGKKYNLTDILNTDTAFADMWKKELKKTYPNVKIFENASDEKLAEIFKKGVWKPDYILQPVFFLTGDSVEVGFSYFAEEGENGYVTLEFGSDKLEKFEKDRKFWETYRKNIYNSP